MPETIRQFRLFLMPCCGQLLCWVNPRLPMHCPECGEDVFHRLKFEPEHTQYEKQNCILLTEEEVQAR